MLTHLFPRTVRSILLLLVAVFVCPVHSTWAHPQAAQRQLTAAQKAQKSEAIRLYNVAFKLRKEEKYAEAIEVLQQVVAIEEKILGPDDPSFGTTVSDLGALHRKLGDYAAAEPRYRQALKISERALGPEHETTATRLNNLAMLYLDHANYADAEPVLQRALLIREKISGPDDPETGIVINNLAYLYSELGKYDAAVPLYQRSLEIDEKAYGKDDAEVATGLSNLAELYRKQARYADAEPLYVRALRICETSLGPEHEDTGLVLNNLAILYDDTGNYAAAEPLYKRALAIDEKTFGPDHPSTAITLNNLGGLYETQGNYAAAEPLYQRSLKIREDWWGPDHPDTALSLNNLASLYDSQGNYAAAEELYKRTLAIEEKAFGPNHPSVARTLNNLGYVKSAQDDFEAAETFYSRALKIKERILGPEHPGVALGLSNLASVYRDQDKHAEAEPLHERALRIEEKAFGPNHPSVIESLEHLAAIYAETGRVEQTTNAYDKARLAIRQHVTQVLPALSAAEQTLYLSANYETDLFICLTHAFMHREQPAIVRTSAAWLINGKAVAQEALAKRNLLTRDINDPVRAPVVRQLMQVRAQLSELAMTAADPEEADRRQQKMAQLAAQEKSLTSQLNGQPQNTSGNTSGGNDSWIEFEQVQTALSDDSVLIDIARFDGYDFSTNDDDEIWHPTRYAAWITPGDSSKDPVLVELGSAEDIDNLVALVREGIQTAAIIDGQIRTEGEAAATASQRKDLAALAARIWQPLQPFLGDAKKIVLSPDGALWLAPWSALPTDDGRYLIEDVDLRFVISGRDLVTQPGKHVTRRSVILANPLFDQNASNKESSIKAIFRTLQPADRESMQDASWRKLLPKVSPLPNTGQEAVAIKPSLDKYSGEKSTLYKERYALERVAKALRSPKVATFATHGFFLPGPNEGDHIASEGTSGAASGETPTPNKNPLLRCGLFLAGCNDKNAVVGDDDGVLTGMEIVSIDFRGTKLVVLSACETGVGDVKNGEGVAGLRQAFRLAGAESVMASLWQVEDRETARLMNLVFQNLADGMTKSEALRQAQISRIEARRERSGAAHPFFWAAFTLTGQE